MAWKYRKESDDSYVLFEDERFEFATLNSQAFMIWQDLLSQSNPKILAAKYAVKYSAAENEIFDDILEIKSNLISLGVICTNEDDCREKLLTCRDIVINPICPASIPISPYRLFVTLTRCCNISCSHCYNESSPHINEYLKIETVLRLVQEAIHNGIFEIVLSGGEPFLYPEIEQVLELAAGKVAISIVTNGMLAKKVIGTLKRFPPNRIQVSLDGDNSIHDAIRGNGAYYKSLDGIARLVDVCQVFVGVTVTNELTESGFRNLCGDIKSIGINTININRLLHSGRASQIKASSLNQIALSEIANDFDIQCNYSGESVLGRNGEFHCGAGVSILSVAADGNVYPCSFLQLCKPEAVGNIYQDSISDIWQSEKMAVFRAANKAYNGPKPCLCDEILSNNRASSNTK